MTGAPIAPVALVTGAAGGIGAGIARTLAARDHRVVLADIDADAAAATAATLDGDAACCGADLGTLDGARAAVDVALARFARLDVLVNNAGGGILRPFVDHDDASIAETLRRNLLTTINCCRAAIPALRATRGRIVNIGAESVRNGLLLHAVYNAAKGGVHGLTTGLARELAPEQVTVNCVAPSIVQTDAVRGMLADRGALGEEWNAMLDLATGSVPLGRPAHVDEVAAMVAFLCSKEAAFVTGQVISVNGGSSML